MPTLSKDGAFIVMQHAIVCKAEAIQSVPGVMTCLQSRVLKMTVEVSLDTGPHGSRPSNARVCPYASARRSCSNDIVLALIAAPCVK